MESSSEIRPGNDAAPSGAAASLAPASVAPALSPDEFLSFQSRVLDSMKEGVCVTDESGYIVYTNPAGDAMFGYAPGELLGRHITVQNAYPPEENRQRVEAVIRLLQEGGVWEGEWRNRRKDGAEFNTRARITAADFHGVKYWVCLQEDITERYRLQLSARQLAAIVETSSDAIISKDLNGVVTSWNRGAELIFGYTAEEMIGQPIARIAAPGRINEMPAILERLRRGERVEHYETERRTKDGRIITVSLTVSPVSDASGQLVGASKIARDVTETKRMREELATREMESRTLLANLPDVISRFDGKARFCYVSPAVEQLTGLAPEHFVGKTLSEAGFPGELAERLTSMIFQIFETGQASNVQFEYSSPRRGARYFQGIGVPEFGPAGQLSSALTIVRDITDRQLSAAAQKATERELMLLIEASGRLLSSPESPEVLRTIIELGQRFIAADAHSVWLKERDASRWKLASSAGLSRRYVDSAFVESADAPHLPSGPMLFEDVGSEPLLELRRDMLAAEGIRSMLAIPLQIHGRPAGAVVFYWRRRHPILPSEVRISAALGNLAAAALGTAELYGRQTESRIRAESSERRAAFLAQSGEILASSLDYETTLRNVAKLAIPAFADWCGVDILDEDGRVRRLAVEHSDPEKVRLAHELDHRYPPAEDDAGRVALRTGHSVLMETIPDDLLVRSVRDENHLHLIRSLGLTSIIVAPMVLGGVSLGAIAFVTAESGRKYAPADLQLAEELARRAAMAVAHARLYRNVQSSEERLRLAVEAAGLGVWERAFDSGALSCSEQCRRNVGIDDATRPLCYEDLAARAHPEDRERWRIESDRAVVDRTPFEIEYRLYFPDSSLHWVLAYGRCLYSDDGRPLRMVGVTMDMTGRKRIEDALRRSNEELRRANGDLNQFAYSASHDLREPLRMMALYTQLLERQYSAQLDETAHEYIQFTLKGARRMEMLIKDLLAYTQTIEVQDEETPLVDAGAIFDEALSNLKSAIEESGAEVHAERLPSVRVNPVHLLQLFQNLIGNAIKYGKSGESPRIRLSCEPDRDLWKFCVADNGIGIPRQYVTQVFGIFKRLHTSDKYSGTGIGLAICQRIVERYGGKIWVESEEDKGSTFYFTLPRERGKEPVD